MLENINKPGGLNSHPLRNNLAKGYMYFYILMSYLLCFGFTIFVPVDPGYKILFKQTTEVGWKTPLASLFFTFCFIMLFYLQYKLVGNIDKKRALFILILVGVVYFVSMPFFSSDVFLYTFKGKIQAELSLNPYEPVKYFDTPYIYLSPWIFVPLAYGPLSNLLFKFVYFKSLSPFMNMYIMKTVFLFFFAAIIWIAYRSSSEKNFIFFVLSPFVLIEGVLCSHLDMMPLLFLVLAIFFLKTEKFPLSFLFLGVATAFKVNFALFMFPFFIECIRKRKRFIIAGLHFALPILVSILVFPGVNKYLDAIRYVGSLDSVSCLKLFGHIPFGKYLFILAAALTFLYFFSLYLTKKIDVLRFSYIFFLIFLLFDKIFQPWHIFPLYALLLFLKREKFDHFGLISFTGIYSVFFLFHEWNPLQNFIATLFILAGIIFALVSEMIDIKKNKYV